MNNLLAKQDLTAEQLSIVQSEFEKQQKSKGIAYALWFFFGGLGGHRFYAGDTLYAIGLLLTTLLISWWTFFIPTAIWVIIDLFLIGKRIEKVNERKEYDILQNVKLMTKRSTDQATAN